MRWGRADLPAKIGEAQVKGQKVERVHHDGTRKGRAQPLFLSIGEAMLAKTSPKSFRIRHRQAGVVKLWIRFPRHVFGRDRRFGFPDDVPIVAFFGAEDRPNLNFTMEDDLDDEGRDYQQSLGDQPDFPFQAHCEPLIFILPNGAKTKRNSP